MPIAEVDTFAGIDVSAHELSVALRRGPGEHKPWRSSRTILPGTRPWSPTCFGTAREYGFAWKPVGITAWI